MIVGPDVPFRYVLRRVAVSSDCLSIASRSICQPKNIQETFSVFNLPCFLYRAVALVLER